VKQNIAMMHISPEMDIRAALIPIGTAGMTAAGRRSPRGTARVRIRPAASPGCGLRHV
jgi:hypothetical protein